MSLVQIKNKKNRRAAYLFFDAIIPNFGVILSSVVSLLTNKYYNGITIELVIPIGL